MISPVVGNVAPQVCRPTLPSRPGAANFAPALEAAATVSSEKVSISKTAYAKSASAQGFDFDLSFTNVNHSQEEFEAHFADGARRISEMQGLPEGQYDFSQLSAKQAHVVVNDMILNKGLSDPKLITGLANFVTANVTYDGDKVIYSDEPKSVIDDIKMQKVSFADGGGFGVPMESLKWVLSITQSAKSHIEDSFLYSPSKATSR